MSKKMPHFKRQRFLLSFLKHAEHNLEKLAFQKLLFLYQEESGYRFYDFIPYHYGCYSFQASYDLEILEKQGWIRLDKNTVKIQDTPEYIDGINEAYLSDIKAFMQARNVLSTKQLLQFVYEQHPFYAINSRILESVLGHAALHSVYEVKAGFESATPGLFTIGYEGVSVERYINTLLKNGIKLLCDIRHNPLSRKFGFSKNSLRSLLPKTGVQYVHIPELGIISSKRSSLETENDYEVLFAEYEQNLCKKTESLTRVYELFKKHGRVALTCFEKEATRCHRHYLGQYIGRKYQLEVSEI